MSEKPGWIRMSIHPIMTDEEIGAILDALDALARNHKEWANDYVYNPHTNEFHHQSALGFEESIVRQWFNGQLDANA